MKAKRFFFYGTLIAGSGNAVAERVHARLTPLGPAAIRGRLFAIPDPDGWYPALVPGSKIVRGVLYEALPSFGDRELFLLDRFEGFDPANRARSLYQRRSLTIDNAMDDKSVAQAYVYASRLPAGARPVHSGDFAGWIKRSGGRLFTPRG